MNDSDWNEYSKILNEGFLKCKHYLKNKFDLLEESSLALKEWFSVDEILLFFMDRNQLKDIGIDARIEFLKNLFEIYFSYSKNLLLYFDIYSEKSITDDTPQMINYLSKVPNFTNHLSHIGYSYSTSGREWTFSEMLLSNERRQILQFMTVCCCLGHSYLETPLKFLNLSIFEKRRRSLLSAMEGQVCECCNFELNVNTFCCSVCEQTIDNMDFFKKWQYTFCGPMVEAKPAGNQVPCINGLSTDTWQCNSCTCINSISCMTCVVCFQQRLMEGNDDKSQRNVGDGKTLQSLPQFGEATWSCQGCTFNNQISIENCAICSMAKPIGELPRDMGNYWLCKPCDYKNFGSTQCRNCGRFVCYGTVASEPRSAEDSPLLGGNYGVTNTANNSVITIPENQHLETSVTYFSRIIHLIANIMSTIDCISWIFGRKTAKD